MNSASHNPVDDTVRFRCDEERGISVRPTEIASIGRLYKYARNDEERTAAVVGEAARRGGQKARA